MFFNLYIEKSTKEQGTVTIVAAAHAKYADKPEHVLGLQTFNVRVTLHLRWTYQQRISGIRTLCEIHRVPDDNLSYGRSLETLIQNL